ncbi:unnamed protein product [Chilo suppressalis]|uniref:Spondin domain-containing protein n=1 Tax=Chilo suppressalis TaxID=168631 RepID=A0ABN8BHU1_CHISP|nr:unnamed protein product [Chilo suppressalis]
MGCHQMISIRIFVLVFLVHVCVCDRETCDRRPFDTHTAPLPPDNRFYIDIDGITERYIPGEQYTVRLLSKDNKSTFIGYTIGLREDEAYNEKNPRRPKHLKPGRLQPSPDSHEGKTRPYCNNTVIHSDITPKTSAQALWIAPDKGSHCVTIYAIVAVKPDVWYNYEGPLSKRVCEDIRNADDILPTQNDDCQVCEEARYQLTFEGLWSYNTHSNAFPKTQELARFSEVVGASHSKYFSVYKYNTEASAGIKMLAEQGNTTVLEMEIQDKLGHGGVRTVVKATAPAKTNMSTVTSFRANKENHLVSLVTGIMPSPDWFLGMANLELCEFKTGQWAKTVKLNLYPLDAGTDSGKDFESSNDGTSPPQPITSAAIAKGEKVKAFARVIVDLIRTYPNPNCTENTSSTLSYDEGATDEPQENGDNIPVQPGIFEPYTTPKSEEPVTTDPESSEACPMTTWEDWPCEGDCVNGTRSGIRLRYRYHIVDGVIVGKYSPTTEEKEVPKYCLKEETFQTEQCEEECAEESEGEEGEEDTPEPDLAR